MRINTFSSRPQAMTVCAPERAARLAARIFVIIPPLLMAVVGAVAALYGAFLNPKVALYLILSVLVILLGLVIRPKKKV
jgi:hypothetical protein